MRRGRESRGRLLAARAPPKTCRCSNWHVYRFDCYQPTAEMHSAESADLPGSRFLFASRKAFTSGWRYVFRIVALSSEEEGSVRAVPAQGRRRQ